MKSPIRSKSLLPAVVSSAMALFLISADAVAEQCVLRIEANDQIEYSESELVVGSECTEVRLTLEHVGDLAVAQMGHNWVLTRTEDWKDVATASQEATVETEYLPPDDPRVITNTKIIGGGEVATVEFEVDQLDEGGDYTYFCSFPGHWVRMNGELIVE